jgi:hypothetical protein
MFENYPDIIRALISEAETDRLRYWDLSSFMTGPSLKEVYEKIDKTMKFFSVYVYMERLENDLWDDDRYVEKEKVILCSRVEEEARKYWWNRSMEHIRLINKRMEFLKNEPEYKDIKENDLKDKIIEDMIKEVYPIAIELLKEEYQEFYEDEWEEYWKKEDPFKERVEYRYHRRYDMPPLFNHWDSRNYWQQYYFTKDHDKSFYYTQGGSGSSGQRYNHGFYGHLFALLNNEKPVPTYFFSYNSRNRFVFKREEKILHLHFFDLIGNFQIDWKESERILKDVVKIRDKNQSVML